MYSTASTGGRSNGVGRRRWNRCRGTGKSTNECSSPAARYSSTEATRGRRWPRRPDRLFELDREAAQTICELPFEVVAAAGPVNPKSQGFDLPGWRRVPGAPVVRGPEIRNQLPDDDDAQNKHGHSPLDQLRHSPVEQAHLPRQIRKGNDQQVTGQIAHQECKEKRCQQNSPVQQPPRTLHASAPQARRIDSRQATASRLSRSLEVRSP